MSSAKTAPNAGAAKGPLPCSFCGKPHDGVGVFVQSAKDASTFICGQCVEICLEINALGRVKTRFLVRELLRRAGKREGTESIVKEI